MILTLCLAISFAFPGGDDHALVASLSTQLNSNAAMVAVSRREWKPIKEEAETRDKLLSAISLGRPIRLATGQDRSVVAAIPPGIPRFLLDRDNSAMYLLHMKNPPEVIRPDASGRYTFNTSQDATPGLAHFELPERKRLRWHWFFDHHRFAVSVRRASADQLLGCLAEAAGAKVVEQPGSSYLDVDWDRLRRMIKEWAEDRKGSEFDGYQKAQLLSLWVVGSSNEQLSKFYSLPTNEVEVSASKDARHATLIREAVKNCMAQRGFSDMIDKMGQNPDLFFIVKARGKVNIRLHNRQINHSFVF